MAPSGPDPGASVCSRHEGTGEGGPEDYRGTFRATHAAVRHCPRSPGRKRCPWQAFSLHTDDLRISSRDRTGSLGWLTSGTVHPEKPHPLCPNPPVPFSFTETPKFSLKVSGYNDDSTNLRWRRDSLFSLTQMILDSEVQSC